MIFVSFIQSASRCLCEHLG